jgi:hypothetical protein
MKKKLLTTNLAKKSFLLILLLPLVIGCKSDKEKYSQNVPQVTDLIQKQTILFDSLNPTWFTEEKNDKTVKTEIITLDGKEVSNQVIRFNRDRQIDTLNSRFFDLQIDDTLSLGRNVGTVNSYTYNKDYDEIYSYVIIENKYTASETRLDTFGNNHKNVMFGIFVNRIGKQIVKGEIFEQYLLPETVVAKDSVTIDLIEIHSYFEKEVFIKDTLDRY